MMGAYVYKVSTKPVGQFQGRPVYPSQFAYKPWSGWSTEATQVNARLSFQSGCEALGAAWRRKSDREGLERVLALYGTTILEINPWGSFVDDFLTPDQVKGSITELEVTDARHLTAWWPGWRETLAKCQEAAAA